MAEGPPCPKCGKKTAYIEQYDKYYCYDCNEYVKPAGEEAQAPGEEAPEPDIIIRVASAFGMLISCFGFAITLFGLLAPSDTLGLVLTIVDMLARAAAIFGFFNLWSGLAAGLPFVSVGLGLQIALNLVAMVTGKPTSIQGSFDLIMSATLLAASWLRRERLA